MSNNLVIEFHVKQYGGKNGVQMNGGEMTNDQLNCNQSSGCQPNEEQRPEERNGDLQTNAGQMIFARDLDIEHADKYENWNWVVISDPRFTEVAVLLKVWFFHIMTSVNFLGLSANTRYGAYLIFKRAEDSKGLDVIMNTSVSVGREHDERSVCLNPTRKTPNIVGRPQEFSDGWLELELGRFYCDDVTADKEVVIIIKETKRLEIKKAGCTIAGIEIRPIKTA